VTSPSLPCAPEEDEARRPRLLDLFAGAGGSAMGYHRAGFEVVGVDIEPQPDYPFEFHQEDAMLTLQRLVKYPDSFIGGKLSAIHASPPCQAYSTLGNLHPDVEYPDLIEATRNLLKQTGLPWVIENVVGAPLHHPIMLCGSMFGLGVRRHRLFETPALLSMDGLRCRHDEQPEPIDVSGTGARRLGDRPNGGGGNSRKPRNLAEAREAMGIDWMTRAELSQSIPPAYTEQVGTQLLAHLSTTKESDHA